MAPPVLEDGTTVSQTAVTTESMASILPGNKKL